MRLTAAWVRLLAGVAALGVTVLACGGSSGESAAPTASASTDPATSLLARVLDRGVLVAFTDPAYPPQSFVVEGASRPPDTKCASGRLTATEVDGFDVEVTVLVAAALGVEPCFVTPNWTELTAGNWGDRWDIAFGSGSIDADRMTRLWMTQPYYSVPNHFFVHTDSAYQSAADLSGKEIGACASCTNEAYLRGELEIPGVEIDLAVEDPVIVTFQTEPPGLEALAAGELDAFLATEPVGRQAIGDGLDLRMLESPVFTEYIAGFVDKGSALATGPFIARVNEIVGGLHADGSLAELSERYFGADYATVAGQFDLEALGQSLP